MFRKQNRETTSCLGNREQRKPIMFRKQRTEKTHHKDQVSGTVKMLLLHFEGEQKQTQSQTYIHLLTSLVQIYTKLAH